VTARFVKNLLFSMFLTGTREGESQREQIYPRLGRGQAVSSNYTTKLLVTLPFGRRSQEEDRELLLT